MRKLSSITNILGLFVNKLPNNIHVKRHVVLERIFECIKDSYSTSYDISIIDNKMINSNDKGLNRILQSNMYIGSNIKAYLHNKTFIYCKLQDSLNTICMYIPSNQNIPSIEKLPKIRIMLHIINFMRKIGNNNNPLFLNILYTDVNKKFDGQLVLGSSHVNSGSSVRGQNILLFRKEEFEKVLIHEMIHFMELDFYGEFNTNYFYDNYGLTQVKLYESFTDSLAIIINSLMVSFYTGYDYCVLLEREIKYVMFQCAKIIKHYNVVSFSHLKNKIKQSTAVFSYYIVKSAMLYSIDILLDFIKNDISIENRSTEYLNLCIMQLENKLYQNNINNLITIVRKHKTNEFLFLTLRMSHLELD